MIYPIRPEMKELDFDWITVTFDETVRAQKAVGDALQAKTEDALKQMREISKPGRDAYWDRIKLNSSFHPKDLGGGHKIRVQEAFVHSRCGTENALMGLLLANAGVGDFSLLSCSLGVRGEKRGGHVMLLLAPDDREEFPNGALLHIGRGSRFTWKGIDAGDFQRFKTTQDRPIFETDKNWEVLREIKLESEMDLFA